MKHKVLTYAADCNTVVNKYMELQPVTYHPQIFTSGLDEYERTSLIFCFNNVYYCEGYYKMKQIIENETKVINHYTGYLENLHTHPWIKNIYMELFRLLGMDTAQLVRERARRIEEKEAKERAIIEKKELTAKAEKEKRETELITAKEKLSAGDKISKDDFIELVKKYKVPVHIRTLGMLNRLKSAEIGTSSAYVFGNNTKGINLQKVFEAAALIAAH